MSTSLNFPAWGEGERKAAEGTTVYIWLSRLSTMLTVATKGMMRKVPFVE